MSRIRVPSGTIQKLEKVFDDLQTNIESNQLKRLNILFNESFGIFFPVINGVPSSNDLKVTDQSTVSQKTKFSVNSGIAFTNSNKYIELINTFTVDSISGAAAGEYRLVKLRYVETGSASMTAMNSFLYDPTVEGTTKYTKFSDSFSIEAVPITEIQGWQQHINDADAVPLAIIKLDGSIRIQGGAWTFTDSILNKTYTASEGIVDLRGEAHLTINSKLINDKDVLKKDRDSTETSGGPLTGSLDITNQLSVGDSLTVSGQTNLHDDVRLSGDDPRLVIGNTPLIQTGVPLTLGFSGNGVSQGTLARFYGALNKRIGFQDLFNVTDGETFPHQAMWINTYDVTNDKYEDLYLGGDLHHRLQIKFDESHAPGNPLKVSIGNNSTTTSHLNDFHVDDMNEDEVLALTGDLVFNQSSDAGITWRSSRDSNNTPFRQGIKLVDTANYSRGGLGFYVKESSAAPHDNKLGLAISKKGQVFIGTNNPLYNDTADGEAPTNILDVTGKTRLGGNSTVQGDLGISANLTVSGITNLSGSLGVTGKATFHGGIDIGDWITVSGLTSNGPTHINLLGAEQSFINFNFKQDEDAQLLMNKGKIFMENALTTALHLGGPGVGDTWGVVSISGVTFDQTKYLSVGSHIKTSNNQFDNKFSLFGTGPGILLRAHPDENYNVSAGKLGEGEDWFIGTKSSSIDKLEIGRYQANHVPTTIMTFSNTGTVGIGAVPADGYRLNVNGTSQFYKTYHTQSTSARTYHWAKSSGDSDREAGIGSDGKMSIGTHQKAKTLTVKDGIQIFGSQSNKAKIHFGSTSPTSTFSMGMKTDSETVFALYKGVNTIFEASMASGIQSTSMTATNMEAGTVDTDQLTASVLLRSTGGSQLTDTILRGETTTFESEEVDFGESNVMLSGVSATEFRIGVGSYGSDGQGVKVLTESHIATIPSNVRIHDIKPWHLIPGSPMSIVIIKNNYDLVQGYGLSTPGKGEFQVTSPVIDETEKSLKGKHFILQSASGTFTYYINAWDNSTKIMELLAWDPVDGEGTGNAYNNETAIGPNYGKIVDVANDIECQFIETDSSGNPIAGIPVIEATVSDATSNEWAAAVDLGKFYKTQVRSRKGTVWSDWYVMGSGIYDPDQTTASGQQPVSYGFPWYNSLPDLPADGVLSLTSSAFGFTAQIDGWSHATDPDLQAQEFQYGYSLGAVDFNTPSAGTIIETTSNRHISVNANNAAQYNFAVRPLQNKQAVGAAITGSVLAGAGGVPPNYVGYWSGEVNVAHYAGTIADASTAKSVGTDNAFIQFDDLGFTKDPFNTVSSGITIGQNELAYVGGGQGHQLEITNGAGNVSYGDASIVQNTVYDDVGGGATMGNMIVIADEFDSGYNQAGNKFEIGGSKASRKIAEFTVGTDITLKMATINLNWTSGCSAGNPGVIRVYQKDQEAQAGTMSISIASGSLSSVMEVEIKASNGPRVVIIDAWDPDNTSPNNSCSMNGVLSIYGQTIIDGMMEGSTT